MTKQIDDAAWDLLFRNSRTHNEWQPRDVPDDLLRKIYDISKHGPTSANSQPMRIVFVRSPEAKAKLLPALSPANAEQTKPAPVTAIFANDHRFFEHLPRMFPKPDARSWFEGKPSAVPTAMRNGTLQCAYFMIVARGFGLDLGAMSGFDQDKCDAAFFPDGRFKSNFLCNIGYGTGAKLPPRMPRLAFDEACSIV